MQNLILDLNSPERYYEIRSRLEQKKSLKRFYREVYLKYQDCLKTCPPGIALEIGSGAGFVKEVIPQIVTSDVIQYPNVDRVMDAAQLGFDDESISFIGLFNVLHHIPNVRKFFNEALRVLVPGGKIFMVEPYAGLLNSYIFRYFHHEGFDPDVQKWEFISEGPVSDANNALPSIIFERDLKIFQAEFPNLLLQRFEPHTPLQYWLTGGLQKWSLLPLYLQPLSKWIDNGLMRISRRLGSFVDIELLKL